MRFVPAHAAKFVASAHRRGADACILDLEDAVPIPQKPLARDRLGEAASVIHGHGVSVLVRVNAPGHGQALDLAAAIGSPVQAIVLPKVNSASDVHAATDLIERLEMARGLPVGHTRLIAQIEDVRALPFLDAIAGSSDRLLGMILGSEDVSVSAGLLRTPESLFASNQQVPFACRRAGLLPLGSPASIAEFADLSAFHQQMRLGRQLGFVGAFCIHPSQVAPMNEEFSPSAAEIEVACALIAAFERSESEGRGALDFRGTMVDVPLVLRARELLRRAQPSPRSPFQQEFS